MKKSMLFVFAFICMFICCMKVEAIKFYEGDYIAGEYVNKVKDGKIYYMTMKYLKDSNGNVLYCLEPFVKFYESYDYSKSNNYNNLSSSVLRKVELLSYYGYGYKNRTSSKWYVITQYLIWKSVSSNDIYFTDKLNGNRISKYVNEMNELLNDVNNHDVNKLIMNYDVSYGSDLIINLDGYKVISSDYEINNNKISKIKDSGIIRVSKISNNYKVNNVIYDGTTSQDLLLRGNVSNKVYDIKINVLKNNILLKINSDYILDDYNVCYEIYNEHVVDQVCSNSNMEYKSIDLSYGKYFVRQSYISDGYEKDNNVYEIDLNEDDEELVLDNKVIRNSLNIYKYYCDELCNVESNAIFNIYDMKDNYVGEVKTNENGYGNIELVYGTYLVKQMSGIDGYSYVNDFYVTIDSGLEDYSYRLENTLISKDEIVELPPDTGIELSWLEVIWIRLWEGLFE